MSIIGRALWVWPITYKDKKFSWRILCFMQLILFEMGIILYFGPNTHKSFFFSHFFWGGGHNGNKFVEPPRKVLPGILRRFAEFNCFVPKEKIGKKGNFFYSPFKVVREKGTLLLFICKWNVVNLSWWKKSLRRETLWGNFLWWYLFITINIGNNRILKK